jgi:hypothetical protein
MYNGVLTMFYIVRASAVARCTLSGEPLPRGASSVRPASREQRADIPAPYVRRPPATTSMLMSNSLASDGRVAVRHHALDHQQARIRRHRGAAGRKDALRIDVVPIVQHAFHQIEIAPARRLRRRKSPASRARALGAGSASTMRAPATTDGRSNRSAAKLRMRAQQRRQQRAVAAADIHHAARMREIVGFEDGGGLRGRRIWSWPH